MSESRPPDDTPPQSIRCANHPNAPTLFDLRQGLPICSQCGDSHHMMATRPVAPDDTPPWQPIDTAPKDGTKVRVARFLYDGHVVQRLACFERGVWKSRVAGHWTPTHWRAND
jgi:hypothetical protein